jgi:hypothetical protein
MTLPRYCRELTVYLLSKLVIEQRLLFSGKNARLHYLENRMRTMSDENQIDGCSSSSDRIEEIIFTSWHGRVLF